MEINKIAEECYQIAKEHGWWDGPVNIPEKLALIHSEVSEALECYRNDEMLIDRLHWSQIGKPEGFPIEIADVIIRLFDLSAHLKIDLEAAIQTKMDYNKTRAYRHGGKRA